MEDLSEALSINQTPGRNPFHKTSWESLAWWSRKILSSWFPDLIHRVHQLDIWSSDLQRPLCMWLPGLFNPMAYLTAIMQVTAREQTFPLDQMTTETHITLMRDPKVVAEHPPEGACCHGLFLEGARWGANGFIEDEEEDLYEVRREIKEIKETKETNRDQKEIKRDKEMIYV